MWYFQKGGDGLTPPHLSLFDGTRLRMVKTLEETLAWALSVGEIERCAEDPIDRYQESAPPTNYKPLSTIDPLKTLAALREAMENFDQCSLKKTATQMVFSDGNPDARIMLIGEAPGAEEDRQGKPFVGMSGQLLDRIFASVGLAREKDLYIANVVPWRPPGNRAPTLMEIELCLPFLRRHIELISPDILIFLGSVATKTLMNSSEGITRLRGQWFPYSLPNKTVWGMPTYHPAYLLRSPGRKKDVWKDMLQLKAKLNSR